MKESLYCPGDILLLAIQPREDPPQNNNTQQRNTTYALFKMIFSYLLTNHKNSLISLRDFICIHLKNGIHPRHKTGGIRCPL